MLRQISATQLRDWQDFYDQRAFGAKRDNHYSALMAMMFYNANKGKSAQPLDLEDFMLVPIEVHAKHRFGKVVGMFKALAGLRTRHATGKKKGKRMRRSIIP